MGSGGSCKLGVLTTFASECDLKSAGTEATTTSSNGFSDGVVFEEPKSESNEKLAAILEASGSSTETEADSCMVGAGAGADAAVLENSVLNSVSKVIEKVVATCALGSTEESGGGGGVVEETEPNDSEPNGAELNELESNEVEAFVETGGGAEVGMLVVVVSKVGVDGAGNEEEKKSSSSPSFPLAKEKDDDVATDFSGAGAGKAGIGGAAEAFEAGDGIGTVLDELLVAEADFD
jgi:hypothetical protein